MGDALETWVRTEVAAAYDRMVEDPTRLIPIELVKARIAAVHSARTGILDAEHRLKSRRAKQIPCGNDK